MVKRGLGKGLGALLPGMEIDEDNLIKEIKLTEIEPNKSQPRKNFDIERLEVLAESIKIHGVIQPIIVSKLENGFYQIIAGERRWRAAKLAGLKTIPIVIKEYEKKEVMEIALIENIQREDLNPIEEAEAYKNLMDEFHLTQEEISERVGKSRPAIANALRLLNLSDLLRQFIVEDKLSSGHARTILSVGDRSSQLKIANMVIKEGLSVRETERLVKKMASNNDKQKDNKKNDLSHIYADVQDRLSKSLGTKVKIHQGKSKSKIEIEYYSDEDLERLMELLKC
ncbi:MAG: ParB/RepB/Spo0J family partition protein [Clostridia bacterium]